MFQVFDNKDARNRLCKSDRSLTSEVNSVTSLIEGTCSMAGYNFFNYAEYKMLITFNHKQYQVIY